MTQRLSGKGSAEWQPVLPQITDPDLAPVAQHSSGQANGQPDGHSDNDPGFDPKTSFFKKHKFTIIIAVIVLIIVVVVVYVYITRRNKKSAEHMEAIPGAPIAGSSTPANINKEEVEKLREMRRAQRARSSEDDTVASSDNKLISQMRKTVEVVPASLQTPAPALVSTPAPAQALVQAPAQALVQTPAQALVPTPAPVQAPALVQTPAQALVSTPVQTPASKTQISNPAALQSATQVPMQDNNQTVRKTVGFADLPKKTVHSEIIEDVSPQQFVRPLITAAQLKKSMVAPENATIKPTSQVPTQNSTNPHNELLLDDMDDIIDSLNE